MRIVRTMNTVKTRRKRSYEKSVPLNITLTPTIMQAMEDLIRARGYKGPVEYISARVRVDAGLEPSIPALAA